jgi:hypothetical protein
MLGELYRILTASPRTEGRTGPGMPVTPMSTPRRATISELIGGGVGSSPSGGPVQAGMDNPPPSSPNTENIAGLHQATADPMPPVNIGTNATLGMDSARKHKINWMVRKYCENEWDVSN